MSKKSSTKSNKSYIVDDIDISKMSREDKIELIKSIEALKEKVSPNNLSRLFTEEGDNNRHNYPKILQFFDAGKNFKERLIFGGNQSGKSFAGAYEAALHATGLYPSWWTGKRFLEETNGICAADSHRKVAEIAQTYLCGNLLNFGSGFIPKELIVDYKSKPNVPNAIEELHVKHVSGGISIIKFRSYEAGRASFQGTREHWVWIDEESPISVYSEALTRTITTKGIVFMTFTPLKGMTDLILSFLPNNRFPENCEVPGTSRWIIQISWDDAKHLDEAQKMALMKTYQPWEIEARTKGLPIAGIGKVYRTLEKDFIIQPFDIPDYWPRSFGLDVGAVSETACIWIAIDPRTGVHYIYDEYYCSNPHPSIHATAIKSRGSWIPGAIDPSANNTSTGGVQVMYEYQKLGLDIIKADNSIDAGIMQIQHMLDMGLLKCFNTCVNLINEYRMYSYGENGKVKDKQKDHALDALKYNIRTGCSRAITKPDDEEDYYNYIRKMQRKGSRDEITGY